MRKGIGVKETGITCQIYQETVAAHLIAFVKVVLACGSSPHLVSEPFFLNPSLNQHSF